MDEGKYETGIKITEKQMEEICIVGNSFHGEWNYSIAPQ
ncbi:MAG TPA: hypothetical protein ENI20_19970 [Bacteroides sp.]|nr:hypothetical protein [Bacteroides sp.]